MILKRLYFSIVVLLLVLVLISAFALYAIPSYLHFLFTGKHNDWFDKLTLKSFTWIDTVLSNQGKATE